MMNGELGNGHDARVDAISISPLGVELGFSLLFLYVPDLPKGRSVWVCTGTLVTLVLTAPTAVSARWHQMSLWMLDSTLTVSGVVEP